MTKRLRLLKSSLKHKLRTLHQRLFDPTFSSWAYDWMSLQNQVKTLYPQTNAYYEFGVAAGGSMREFLRAVERYANKHRVPYTDFRIFGFDSFAGLPPKQGTPDDRPDWRPGDMRHLEREVLEKIKAFDFPLSRVELIGGFFEQTLTPALRDRLAKTPPSIITLDCDYYSSTLTVLRWLEPFIPSGAVLYFDDIWAFHGSPEHGQLKAIAEINARGVIHLEPCPKFGLAYHSYICFRMKD